MQVQTDLPYGPHVRNRLDYYPAPQGAPVVIYIHGGAFMLGDKANTEWGDMDSIRALVAGGFAVASVNYRYSTQAIWPAQLQDLLAALAFLRARAGELGFDPARIGCFGPSAGGHLSACLAIAAAGDPATALQACAAWFPPVDFLQMDADMRESGVPPDAPPNSGAESPESLLVGRPITEDPALTRAATPLGLLDVLPQGRPLPPVFIQHGMRDALIAARQSLRLQEALVAHGARCAVELLPDGTHGHGAFDDPATMGRVVAFFRSELGH
jgi:acetyl esterase/lipase